MSQKDRARAQAEKCFLGKVAKIDSEAERPKFEGLLKWAKSNGVGYAVIEAERIAAEARIEANDGEVLRDGTIREAVA